MCLGAVYTLGDTGFKVSGNYVAKNGADSSAGLGTDESASTSSWQLFYEGEAFDGNLLAQVGYSFEPTTLGHLRLPALGAAAPPLLTAKATALLLLGSLLILV